jgi:site-specific DNA-cytosine methylase
MTFVKAIRSGARDAEGNLPPEVWKPDTTCPTLSAFDNNSETRATVLAFDTQFGANANVFEEHSPTLKATQQSPSATTNAGVRRLTPIECERLMGWPDNWTLHTATGKQADSHRYRQTGNGVVANITHWIGTRLHP